MTTHSDQISTGDGPGLLVSFKLPADAQVYSTTPRSSETREQTYRRAAREYRNVFGREHTGVFVAPLSSGPPRAVEWWWEPAEQGEMFHLTLFAYVTHPDEWVYQMSTTPRPDLRAELAKVLTESCACCIPQDYEAEDMVDAVVAAIPELALLVGPRPEPTEEPP